MTHSNEDRIDELESKFGFQEQLLDQLNEVIISQQKQLDECRAGLRQLQANMQELYASQGDSAGNLADEKPPHY